MNKSCCERPKISLWDRLFNKEKVKEINKFTRKYQYDCCDNVKEVDRMIRDVVCGTASITRVEVK